MMPKIKKLTAGSNLQYLLRSDPKYRQCVLIFSIIDTLPVALHHISAYRIVEQHLGFNIMHHFCL